MADELARQDAAPLAEAPSVPDLLRLAVTGGLSPEGLEKLVLLQERILDRTAAQAFAGALREFQRDCPVVPKNKKANIAGRSGTYEYEYADLEQITRTIRPHMDRHGLSYAFDSEWRESRLRVTCILRHVGGHSERTFFEVPVGSNAGMSEQQKAASALSYAQRYALRMALGLTTGEGTDDDGQSGGSATITPEQVYRLNSLITLVGADLPRFLAYLGAKTLDAIPADQFARAEAALEQKRRHAPAVTPGGASVSQDAPAR